MMFTTADVYQAHGKPQVTLVLRSAEYCSFASNDFSRGRVRSRLGVCGGKACIAGTRIPVWGLVDARRQGMSDDEILENYPVLHLDDLLAAWEYEKRNPKMIASQIAENDAIYEGL